MWIFVYIYPYIYIYIYMFTVEALYNNNRGSSRVLPDFLGALFLSSLGPPQGNNRKAF